MNQETLLNLVIEESDAQRNRFKENSNFKQLKKEGLLLHPVRINKRSYGYLDYPEFTFNIPFQQDTNLFKSGLPVEIVTDKERFKAILIGLDGNNGECRIFSSDFPSEVLDGNFGIQLSFDEHTNNIMKDAIKNIGKNPKTIALFDSVYSSDINIPTNKTKKQIDFENQNLNESQKNAIKELLEINEIGVIHGPPGTGKTTTIVELCNQKVKQGQNIIISTPSNAAIDHLGNQLMKSNIPFIRLGNNAKVAEELRPYTLEGLMEKAKIDQQIKKYRIQADQLRKIAFSYKRNFGKDERDQKKLILQEVKSIRQHIKKIQDDFQNECLRNNPVIIGTPVAIYDSYLDYNSYDSLIMDEAAQCLDPLLWAIAPLAKQIILAGDPFQLPPTVISNNALKKTLIEHLVTHANNIHLLNIQYRMAAPLIAISNAYFYNNKLKSDINNTKYELQFFDTAGAEYYEKEEEDSGSIYNDDEIEVVKQLIEKKELKNHNTVIIAPYSAQVSKIKQQIPGFLCTTIDSIQGQEYDNVIVSLVRSNTNAKIGFLKDYRRMNVALTRSKQTLYIVGDSSTLDKDPFYHFFLKKIEELNAYDSIFSLIY